MNYHALSILVPSGYYHTERNYICFSGSASAAKSSACAPRWVRLGTALTMPCARASSPPWSGSRSIEQRFARRPRLLWRSSSSSKASTTRIGAIPASASSRLRNSSAGIMNRSIRVTHSRLPTSEPGCAQVKRRLRPPVDNRCVPSPQPSTEPGQHQCIAILYAANIRARGDYGMMGAWARSSRSLSSFSRTQPNL